MTSSELWQPGVPLSSITYIAVECQFTETFCRCLPVLFCDHVFQSGHLPALSPDLYHADHDFTLQTPRSGKALACSPKCLENFGWAGFHPGQEWDNVYNCAFLFPPQKAKFCFCIF